jgi:hypothetical protein
MNSPSQRDIAYCLLPTSAHIDSGKNSNWANHDASLVLCLELWQKSHSYTKIHGSENSDWCWWVPVPPCEGECTWEWSWQS